MVVGVGRGWVRFCISRHANLGYTCPTFAEMALSFAQKSLFLYAIIQFSLNYFKVPKAVLTITEHRFYTNNVTPTA